MSIYRIKWHGYELTIEANVFNTEVEIEDIDGISLVDFYHNADNYTLGEIETLVLEQEAERQMEAASYQDHDTLYERY